MVIDEALQRQFDARMRQIDVYERTWWTHRTDPQRSFLANNPEVRRALTERLADGQPVYTADVYSTDGGSTWVPDRVVLHDDLATRLLIRDDAAEQPDQVDAVYFLLGLPGSGKSQSLRPLALEHAGLVREVPVVDADAVRVEFPEFRDGLGSGVVQAETVVVTYGAGYRAGRGTQDRTLARGGVVMVDTIGDATQLPRVVEQVADQGRRVFVLRTDCPADLCRERAMRRCLESGRYVPLDLIDQKVGFPDRALDAAVATGRVDGWAVVDTSSLPLRVTGSDDFVLPAS